MSVFVCVCFLYSRYIFQVDQYRRKIKFILKRIFSTYVWILIDDEDVQHEIVDLWSIPFDGGLNWWRIATVWENRSSMVEEKVVNRKIFPSDNFDIVDKNESWLSKKCFKKEWWIWSNWLRSIISIANHTHSSLIFCLLFTKKSFAIEQIIFVRIYSNSKNEKKIFKEKKRFCFKLVP